jgi:plastocyanin
MTDTTSTPPSDAASAPSASSDRPAAGGWDRTLAVLAAVVAVADLAIQLLAGVIPPLIVFGVLGLIGVALLRVRPRAGRITLLVLSILGLVGGAPFGLPSLTHTSSPADFLHAVTSIPLRAVVVVSAIAALRGWGGAAATRRAALAGVALLVVVSGVAVLAAPDSTTAGPDDVVLAVGDLDFVDGDDLALAAGQRLVVDNTDLIRHTFTVEGTDVDLELPPGRAVAADLDLAAGTYPYVCVVPGHEFMTGTLTVGS